MGQEDGEKAAAAVDLQPATAKSDSLLADTARYDSRRADAGTATEEAAHA